MLRRSGVGWSFVLLALTASPLWAGDAASLGITLGVGYDTNGLRVTGDGPDSTFTEVRLDGRWKVPLGAGTSWFVDGVGRETGATQGVLRRRESRVEALPCFVGACRARTSPGRHMSNR